VPGKGGLPHAKVEVGSIDTIDAYVIVLVDKVEDGTELVDVPFFDGWVGQRARDISSVDGRIVTQIPPVLAIKIFVIKMGWSYVFSTVGQFSKLPHFHRFLLNVEQSVDALFALHDLPIIGRD